MDSINSYSFSADRPLGQYNKSDFGFLLSVLLLWGFGTFTLVVCSQNASLRITDNANAFYLVGRHLICSLIGFIGFLVFALADVRLIRKVLPVIVIGTVFMCLLTFIPEISEEKNGARRWIKMPFNFTFQPSEMAKFAVILFLANRFDVLSRIENPEEKSVLSCVIGLGVIVGVIFLQKDFSTGMFVFILGLLLFFVSGTKMTWLIPFSPLALGILVLLITLEPYRIDRIIGFLRPTEGAVSINYQSLAAKRAISSGGLLGNGIGSNLIRMNSIPEVQADYIFAGWTEAFGLIGVVIYFVLLGFFAYRGFKIAVECKNQFASYVSFGCVACIFFQSVVNISVVCGLMPTTGVPLPFFSLGGSSIIVTLLMCGFILNASRCEEDDDIYPVRDSKKEKFEYMNVSFKDI